MKLFKGWSALVWVLPGLHLCLCLFIAFGLTSTGAATHAGGWNWFALFLLDFPASMLLMKMAVNFNQPGLVFGVGGTLWWLLISLAILLLLRGLIWLVRAATGRRSRAPE